MSLLDEITDDVNEDAIQETLFDGSLVLDSEETEQATPIARVSKASKTNKVSKKAEVKHTENVENIETVEASEITETDEYIITGNVYGHKKGSSVNLLPHQIEQLLELKVIKKKLDLTDVEKFTLGVI